MRALTQVIFTDLVPALCFIEVLHALMMATEGRTSIVIAHRLSTVVNCDKILVLNKVRLYGIPPC